MMATTRRGGVVVSERKYSWHKLWHDRLLGNPGFSALPMEARGVYLTLRLIGAQTWNAGSLTIGGRRHCTTKDVTTYVAMLLGGDPVAARERAKAILNSLKIAGLVAVDRERVVYIAGWRDEQGAAPTPEAERKRRQRAREGGDPGEAPGGPAGGAGGDPGGDPPAPGEAPAGGAGGEGGDPMRRAARAFGPPAPVPVRAAPVAPSDRSGFGSDSGDGGECDRGVTSHTRQKRTETEEGGDEIYTPESNRSVKQSTPRDASDSVGAAAPSGAGGPKARAAGFPAAVNPAGMDFYAMDPVDAAVALTGEGGAWAVNGFRRAFAELGQDRARQVIGELRVAMEQGQVPSTVKPSRYLHGIVRRMHGGSRGGVRG